MLYWTILNVLRVTSCYDWLWTMRSNSSYIRWPRLLNHSENSRFLMSWCAQLCVQITHWISYKYAIWLGNFESVWIFRGMIVFPARLRTVSFFCGSTVLVSVDLLIRMWPAISMNGGWDMHHVAIRCINIHRNQCFCFQNEINTFWILWSI